MNSNKHSNNDDWKTQADHQWIEALLAQHFHPDPDQKEKRVAQVLENIDQPIASAPKVELPTNRQRKIAKTLWLLAVSLFLCLGAYWWMNSATRQAHAAVARSLKWSQQNQVRSYRVLVDARPPILGPRKIESQLYVKGASRFVLKHPSLLPNRYFWLGGNDKQYWLIPPPGQILKGDRALIDGWLNRRQLSTPYLHMTSLLKHLAHDYDLELLPATSIDNLIDPALPVKCQHIRGIRQQEDTLTWPATIDFYSDPKTGIARRVILKWNRGAKELGPEKITLDYTGQPQLPNNWFDPTGHLTDPPATKK